MRPLERLQAEEMYEALGGWKAARVTVCLGCDRYKVTDAEAWCRRCSYELDTAEGVDEFVSTFEATAIGTDFTEEPAA